VQRITQIYENADQVIVWLGPLDSNSDLAFDLLEKIFKLAESKVQDWTTIAGWVTDASWRTLISDVICELFDKQF
jgi:hypothetical protein